jgi:Na+-driven multidrug efflux pump
VIPPVRAVPADSTIRSFEVTHRGVLAIAVPMTLAYLSTPVVGVVNLGVVGQVGDPAMVGGVAIGALIFNFIFTTFNFLRSGTTGLVAQAVGAGDRAEASAWLARALLLALAIGAVVVVLREPIADLGLRLIGGSASVQAATRDYWHVRALATPFALANYVILGWLIGLGRAGLGLASRSRSTASTSSSPSSSSSISGWGSTASAGRALRRRRARRSLASSSSSASPAAPTGRASPTCSSAPGSSA